MSDDVKNSGLVHVTVDGHVLRSFNKIAEGQAWLEHLSGDRKRSEVIRRALMAATTCVMLPPQELREVVASVVRERSKQLDQATYAELDSILRETIALLTLFKAQREIIGGRAAGEAVEQVILSVTDSLLTLRSFKPESIKPGVEPERIEEKLGHPWIRSRDELLANIKTVLDTVNRLVNM